MTPERRALADVVLDPENSPAAVLGAVLAFVKQAGTPDEQRVAIVADQAIRAEFDKIERERGQGVRMSFSPEQHAELVRMADEEATQKADLCFPERDKRWKDYFERERLIQYAQRAFPR